MQNFAGTGSGAMSDGFSWTDGPVMCMLATRAGPDRLITLFAVTTDRQLVISSYPVCDTADVLVSFPAIRYANVLVVY